MATSRGGVQTVKIVVEAVDHATNVIGKINKQFAGINQSFTNFSQRLGNLGVPTGVFSGQLSGLLTKFGGIASKGVVAFGAVATGIGVVVAGLAAATVAAVAFTAAIQPAIDRQKEQIQTAGTIANQLNLPFTQAQRLIVTLQEDLRKAASAANVPLQATQDIFSRISDDIGQIAKSPEDFKKLSQQASISFAFLSQQNPDLQGNVLTNSITTFLRKGSSISEIEQLEIASVPGFLQFIQDATAATGKKFEEISTAERIALVEAFRQSRINPEAQAAYQQTFAYFQQRLSEFFFAISPSQLVVRKLSDGETILDKLGRILNQFFDLFNKFANELGQAGLTGQGVLDAIGTMLDHLSNWLNTLQQNEAGIESAARITQDIFNAIGKVVDFLVWLDQLLGRIPTIDDANRQAATQRSTVTSPIQQGLLGAVPSSPGINPNDPISNIGSSSRATGTPGLINALRNELAAKPPGSGLVIANSSEVVLTQNQFDILAQMARGGLSIGSLSVSAGGTDPTAFANAVISILDQRWSQYRAGLT